MKPLKRRHLALAMVGVGVGLSLAVAMPGPRPRDDKRPPPSVLREASSSNAASTRERPAQFEANLVRRWHALKTEITSALGRSARSQVPTDRQKVFFVAYVRGKRIQARTEPRPRAPVIASFGPRTELGTPQVFLIAGPRRAHPPVVGRKGSWWYKALLPVRPNGTTGYLPAAGVQLTTTPFRIVVDRTRFRLELWRHSRLVRTFPVGIGTGKTPTPVGRFYIASLLRPPTPNSAYGPYAYGLSAYSDVLTDWRGGGIIGLHGTNDPGSVGRPASHGCIRMRNNDIRKLVRLLPLGTPIRIR